MKSAGNWPLKLLVRAGLVRIAPLGERHRAGVEPAVDHFGHAAHPGARGLGRIVGDGVDVRLVDLQVVGQLGILPLGLLPHFGALRRPAWPAVRRSWPTASV